MMVHPDKDSEEDLATEDPDQEEDDSQVEVSEGQQLVLRSHLTITDQRPKYIDIFL